MIYFDNSATTRPYQEVVDLIARLSIEEFGNPSSMHMFGMRAEKILENARKTLAGTVQAAPQEIIFTSGGTESVNMALRGSIDALKRKGNHILTSPVEHAAALETLKAIQDLGFEVEMLEVDFKGRIIVEDLVSKLRKDTLLVNCMLVNNETGAIQPVEEIGALIKSRNPGICFHVDAVQAYGKLTINVKDTNASLMSFSAHKVHGPKGVGMLYVSSGMRLSPILLGGGQERSVRSGTVNVPGIAGFSLAAAMKCERMNQDNAVMRDVKNTLSSMLDERFGESIHINSTNEGIPNILNISFSQLPSEVILHALEKEEIYVSTGSACHSKKDTVSHVLKAMRLPAKWTQGAVRFSFSGDNTVDEARTCAEKLIAILERYSTIRR